MRTIFRSLLLLFVFVTTALVALAQTPRLKVSENKRFLVTADGKPFFYLGDTAWELFHRLNREEADRYLKNRADKGFTVIQAVALAELDRLNDPNPYGHRPLLNNDPTMAEVKNGANDDYWDHVDYIVKKAEALGLYIGFLPTRGDKWNKKRGVGPEVFTPQNAEVYGHCYEMTRVDYDRTPVKPVFAGEPIYEDHPISFKAKELGHSVAADVRRPLYWDLFTGAFGHTYGHHSVWQMWQPGRNPINNPLMPWFEAIDQPGAAKN